MWSERSVDDSAGTLRDGHRRDLSLICQQLLGLGIFPQSYHPLYYSSNKFDYTNRVKVLAQTIMEVDVAGPSNPTVGDLTPHRHPSTLNVTSDIDNTAVNSPSGTNPPPSSRLTASPAGSSKEENCPACTPARKRNTKTTHWIECEACGSWFHWDCVSESGTADTLNSVDKWYVE